LWVLSLTVHFFLCKIRCAKTAAKIAAKANSASKPGGDGTGVGVAVVPGEGLCAGVGVAAKEGIGVTAGVGVGVGVGVIFNAEIDVTCHIHECISDVPFVVLIAIAETFQIPTTALVFV